MNLFFTATLLYSISHIYAQTVGRAGASCGYLSNKGIYCFGGASSSGVLPASNIYFLDIPNNVGKSVEELTNKWTAIESDKTDVFIQPMERPQSMVLYDGATMLISGGMSDQGTTLAAKTVGYNADNNSWIAYPDYTDPPFGTRQIFRASSVYVPEYGVGFYGGREANKDPNWTLNGQNVSDRDSPNIPGVRYIGYTKLIFFDVRKKSPWYDFPTQNNLPTGYVESQTSIFDPINNMIFFLGGGYYNVTQTALIFGTLKSAATFDLSTGSWGTQAFGGKIKPTPRSLHSTTLLTSTNRDVLLYGGQGSLGLALDYLFVLNLDSFEWKQHHLSSLDETNLIRSEHSAVLVNDTLFIMFGRDQEGKILSSMIMLNVSDPSRISVASKSNVQNSEYNSASELSSGAIAGIAIGAAIAGIIITLAIVYFLWKRYKKKHNNCEPSMENINWEEIEKNYEVNDIGSPGNSNQFSQSTESPTVGTKDISTVNIISARPDANKILVRPDSDNVQQTFQKPDSGI